MKSNQTYNPCDACQYSYSKTGEESSMCKICEFTYFRDLRLKEGRWIERVDKPEWLEDDVVIYYECSGCGIYSFDQSHYCPNCGARMVGE